MNSIGKHAVSGLLWTFTERFSVQGIQFITSLVLARLLLPEDFGMIGMILIFVSIGTTLRDSGMTSSLVRSEAPSEADYSTVFFVNLTASILIYTFIFFTAPLVADFYNNDRLANLVRVQSLTIIIGAFSSIQYTRLTKSLRFKQQMTIQLPAMLIGGAMGIGMALLGYGVWSLVWMNVFQSLAATVQYWFLTNWKPKGVFSCEKFKEHFHFGYKITLSGVLDTMYSNFLYVIIGKFFTASQLGFYTRANSTKNLPLMNISAALYRVTFPLFAAVQQDNIHLKAIYKKLMQQVLFWVVPCLFSIVFVAEPLFRVLFTEKWVPAAAYFQILCFMGVLYPLNAYNLNILTVKGRSDLYLRVQLINKGYTIMLTAAMIPLGITAMLWAQVVATVLNYGVNAHYSGKLIQYRMNEQVKHVMPIFLIGGGMIATCYGINHILVKYGASDMMKLVLVPIVGWAIYFSLAILFKIEALQYIGKLIFSSTIQKKKAVSSKPPVKETVEIEP